jgi:hypothetical protein
LKTGRKPDRGAARLTGKGRDNGGKSNRVLHTEQLPKNREMGVP